MLDSVKIAKRQSEIRQGLAALAGKDKPTEDEVRQMGDLDREYQTNETRFRAAPVRSTSGICRGCPTKDLIGLLQIVTPLPMCKHRADEHGRDEDVVSTRLP